jgi:hypothetical protein
MGAEILIPQIGENITFSPGDWLAFQIGVQQRAYDLGYKVGLIMLIIGCIIGFISGYYYCKGKYGSSQ